MNINNHKEKFIREHLFDIEELSVEEVEQIPKTNKAEEYAYLSKRGYFCIDNKYYKKIELDIKDQDMMVFTQIKMVDLLNNINQSTRDIQITNKNIEKILNWIMVSIVVLIIVILFF